MGVNEARSYPFIGTIDNFHARSRLGDMFSYLRDDGSFDQNVGFVGTWTVLGERRDQAIFQEVGRHGCGERLVRYRNVIGARNPMLLYDWYSSSRTYAVDQSRIGHWSSSHVPDRV